MLFPMMRAVPCRPGSVELGGPRQAVEVARVDGDAGGALGGHEGGQGDEECCSGHEFDPSFGWSSQPWIQISCCIAAKTNHDSFLLCIICNATGRSGRDPCC